MCTNYDRDCAEDIWFAHKQRAIVPRGGQMPLVATEIVRACVNKHSYVVALLLL